MNKFIYYLSMTLLSFIAIFLLYIAFLLFKPFRIPTVSPDPIPIVNKIVHYGEAIQSKTRSCVFSPTPVTTSVRYQNSEGRVYFFSSHDSVGVVGCKDSTQNRDPIPSSLPPGKYVIYITAIFHVNPLRDVSHVYQTEEFTLAGISPEGSN